MPDETHSMDRIAKSTEAIEALLTESSIIRALKIWVLLGSLVVIFIFGVIEIVVLRAVLK